MDGAGESPATQRLLANADALALVCGFLDGASLARAGAACAAFADAALGGAAQRFDTWRLAALRRWPGAAPSSSCASHFAAWPLGHPPREAAAARRAFARRAVLARLCRELVRAAAASRVCAELAQVHCAALGPEALAPLEEELADATAAEAAAKGGAGAAAPSSSLSSSLPSRRRAAAWALLRNLAHTARAAALSALSARAQAQAYSPAAAAELAAAAATEAAEADEPLPRSLSGGGGGGGSGGGSSGGGGNAAGAPVRLEDGFVLLSSLGAQLPLADADREREYVAARLGAAGIARRLDELAERVRAALRAEPPCAGAGAGAAPSVRTQLLAVNRVLLVEEGFRLSSAFTDPRDSLLADVLAARRGLPILLCAVYEAVCRRVGVPHIKPVGLPSFFVLKYDPPGAASRRDGGGATPNAPVELGPEPRPPEVDAATALRFADDEEAFIFVGFNGVFAARPDVERFVLERMGFSAPNTLAAESNASNVWVRALNNILRGTTPTLLQRTAPESEVANLIAFAQVPFSPDLFWPPHALSAGRGGAGEPAPAARMLGLEVDSADGEARSIEKGDAMKTHAEFRYHNERHVSRLQRAAVGALFGSANLGSFASGASRITPALLRDFEAGEAGEARPRCERALAALWLLRGPLPEAEASAVEAAQAGAGASPAAAARARLELRRHALFQRVAAVLRGAEDIGQAWREMVAEATTVH